jgi:hypothetical protein
MKRNIALLIALPVLTLAIGIAIGCAITRTDTVESQVIPAASLKGFRDQTLNAFCGQTSVYSDFMRSDAVNESVHTQKLIRGIQMTATPLSDRGLICNLSASVVTRRSQPNGIAVATTAVEHITYLVAINGYSEIITEDFAKTLLKSGAVSAMASNWGNDGSVVPVAKVSF